MKNFKLIKHPSGIYCLKRVKRFYYKKAVSFWLVVFLFLQMIAGVLFFPPVREAEAGATMENMV